MTRAWSDEETKFVKDNADEGINWLCDHMNRSKFGIQRIAFIKGYAIKNVRRENRVKKAPKKPQEPFVTADAMAQESVKAIQAIPWPSKCHQTN